MGFLCGPWEKGFQLLHVAVAKCTIEGRNSLNLNSRMGRVHDLVCVPMVELVGILERLMEDEDM